MTRSPVASTGGSSSAASSASSAAASLVDGAGAGAGAAAGSGVPQIWHCGMPAMFSKVQATQATVAEGAGAGAGAGAGSAAVSASASAFSKLTARAAAASATSFTYARNLASRSDDTAIHDGCTRTSGVAVSLENGHVSTRLGFESNTTCATLLSRSHDTTVPSSATALSPPPSDVTRFTRPPARTRSVWLPSTSSVPNTRRIVSSWCAGPAGPNPAAASAAEDGRLAMWRVSAALTQVRHWSPDASSQRRSITSSEHSANAESPTWAAWTTASTASTTSPGGALGPRCMDSVPTHSSSVSTIDDSEADAAANRPPPRGSDPAPSPAASPSLRHVSIHCCSNASACPGSTLASAGRSMRRASRRSRGLPNCTKVSSTRKRRGERKCDAPEMAARMRNRYVANASVE